MRMLLISTVATWMLTACDRGPSADAPTAAPASKSAPSAAGSAPNAPATPSAPSPTALANPSKPSKPEAAGVGWKPPKAFVAVAPASAMRKAQYRVSSDQDAPELIVHYFGPGQGGGVQQNLDRWIGQMKQADGSDSKDAAKTKTLTSSGGIKVHTVDVSGTFSSNMPGQNAGPQKSSRLLGAIAEGPQGSVFFKVVGDSDDVGAAKDGFDALVQSLHPK